METQIILSKIYVLRGFSVMLDDDLASLYEVPTKALNQAVKRNIGRFPKDFMFQLTLEEWTDLKSQFVATSDPMWSQIVTTSKKHRRDAFVPYAFTEQGVSMLSSVLRSEKAILVNIAIMRAFVALRHFALTYTELSQKMAELEAQTGKSIADIHEVLRWLGQENQARSAEIAAMEPASSAWETRRPIGFQKED